MVVLAFAESAETLDGVGEVDEFAGRTREDSATWNGCDRKRSILRARATVILSSSDNSSMPRMAMMSCSDL